MCLKTIFKLYDIRNNGEVIKLETEIISFKHALDINV